MCRGPLAAAPLVFSLANVCRGCLVIVAGSRNASDVSEDVSALGGEGAVPVGIADHLELRRRAA